MKIIAVFNQAGGVAKTTLTFNLGYALSQRNNKVLVVDADPQGTLTHFCGLEPSDLDRTVYNALLDYEPLPVHSVHGFDLAPANIELSGAELELVVADLRDYRMKKALQQVEDLYDFILIDCPPSLGILSYLSLVAATHVLVPIQTQSKAFKGTELLFKTVSRVRRGANPELKIAGFAPTIFRSQATQDRRTLEAINQQMATIAPVFPPIAQSTAFADAAEDQVPIQKYKPNHPAIKVLDRIAQHMEEMV